MREYQTLDKLEEKVYLIDPEFTDEEITNTLNQFLKEAISRKRNDPFEGGLQAGGIIFPEKSAFKINEKDGLAPHSHTYETLAQYIDGETMFSNPDTLGKISARIGDPHSWIGIGRIGFEVRLLMGEEQLIVAINTNKNNNDLSLFQLKVADIFVKCIKQLYQEKLLKYVSVNYTTKDDSYLFSDTDKEAMTEEDFVELEDLLKTRIEERKVL